MKKEDKNKSCQALKRLINKSTGQNEATAADGGNLVYKDVVPQIFSPDFATNTLYSRCRIINVGDEGRFGIKVPIANETTRSTSGIKGGVRAYWVNEGVAATPSNATFAQLDLPLNRLVGVVAVTDELKEDSQALQDYLSNAVPEAIFWKVDRSILYGSTGQINGILNNGGQATAEVSISDPILVEEVEDIHKEYYGGANGIWVMDVTMYNQIIDLASVSVVDSGIALNLDSDKSPWGSLYGYPIMVSDVVNAKTIILADFSQFVIAQKEIKTSVNESLLFLKDEQYFKWVLRINGNAIWKSGITVQDGDVVYPFVVGGVDADISSSSTESSSSSSIDSSSSTSQSSESTTPIDVHSSSSSSSQSSASSNSSSSSSSSSSNSSSSSSSPSSSSSSSSVDSSSSSSSS